LAAIQRGSEGLQAISMFYTFFSQLHQRLSETGRQMKGKQRIKGTPNVIARLTWLVMLPVFMEVVVRREWPDEDEEPVEFWLKRILLYGTVTIPILRDVANGVFSDYGYSVSPVAQTGKRIVGGLTGIWNIGGNVLGLHDEEITDAQMRGIMDTIGVTAKLPTGQLWILYNWLKRAESDELENPLHELVYKARRE
jgi:hypothetical protein